VPDVIGKLKKVIWRSLENDFTIASFTPEKIGMEFIATGDLFKPAAGITYNLTGEWQDHPKYGEQFKIDSYCVQAPCDYESISVYLEKYVKGVGPVLADKLIEKYRENTISILKGAPERVSNENQRISYNLALEISNQLQEDDKRRDVLINLEGLFAKVKGLSKRLAQDVLKIYGLSALEVIKSNPYQLIGISRMGFVSADKVAMACGVKADDKQRVQAGILYVIQQTMQESGDVWLSPITISDNLKDMVISEITVDAIKNILDNFIKDKMLVEHEGFVTLEKYAQDEDIICQCVGGFLL